MITDIIMIAVAIIAVYFILKIAFKVLKFALLIGVVAFLLHYFGVFSLL